MVALFGIFVFALACWQVRHADIFVVVGTLYLPLPVVYFIYCLPALHACSPATPPPPSPPPFPTPTSPNPHPHPSLSICLMVVWDQDGTCAVGWQQTGSRHTPYFSTFPHTAREHGGGAVRTDLPRLSPFPTQQPCFTFYFCLPPPFWDFLCFLHYTPPPPPTTPPPPPAYPTPPLPNTPTQLYFLHTLLHTTYQYIYGTCGTFSGVGRKKTRMERQKDRKTRTVDGWWDKDMKACE